MKSVALARIEEARKMKPHLLERRIPLEEYKRQQAQISRRRLYPVTILYSTFSVVILILGFRSKLPILAVSFFVEGIILWTLIEYLFHRYVLHGSFADGKGIVHQFAHRRLDPLHWEHHARPLDGMHINGALGDLLVFFMIAAPVSLLFPIYTLPPLLAGTVQCYVLEEWIHQSTHFYRFRNPYSRYIRRHHGYHHTPAGTDLGLGITNGFWDLIFNTSYPEPVRRVLYGTGGTLNPGQKRKAIYELDEQISVRLQSAASTKALTRREVIDLALADTELARSAAVFGEPEEIISQALVRLQQYGLIEIRDDRLTVIEKDWMAAYAG